MVKGVGNIKASTLSGVCLLKNGAVLMLHRSPSCCLSCFGMVSCPLLLMADAVSKGVHTGCDR